MTSLDGMLRAIVAPDRLGLSEDGDRRVRRAAYLTVDVSAVAFFVEAEEL